MPNLARPNLTDKLAAALPPTTRRTLDSLVSRVERDGTPLYLVGGSVRDLLLGHPSLDIDLTAEGDAIELVRSVAAGLRDATCRAHPAFGTATLSVSGSHIDVASARAESYERPGALPSVRPGGLRDDLQRRDFTINAIALALTGSDRGSLVDPFDGAADLSAGLIRVLHDGSFRDDATRVIRAARYESRLGFRIEPHTESLLRRDLSSLDTISGARVRQELLRTLHEDAPERTFLRLAELGALRAMHPALSLDAGAAAAFARLRELRRGPSLTSQLALLARSLTAEQVASLAGRLALTRREAEAVAAMPRLRDLESSLGPGARPSEAVRALSPFPPAALWAFAAASETARQTVLRYLRRWRAVKPSLTGRDLMAMGAPQGPKLGEVLRRLLDARLDGDVRSFEDEVALARRLLDLPVSAR